MLLEREVQEKMGRMLALLESTGEKLWRDTRSIDGFYDASIKCPRTQLQVYYDTVIRKLAHSGNEKLETYFEKRASEVLGKNGFGDLPERSKARETGDMMLFFYDEQKLFRDALKG